MNPLFFLPKNMVVKNLGLFLVTATFWLKKSLLPVRPVNLFRICTNNKSSSKNVTSDWSNPSGRRSFPCFKRYGHIRSFCPPIPLSVFGKRPGVGNVFLVRKHDILVAFGQELCHERSCSGASSAMPQALVLFFGTGGCMSAFGGFAKAFGHGFLD